MNNEAIIREGRRQPLGYQQLTGISSSTPLTVPSGAMACLIQAEAQDIRWRDDGVAPTASIGMKLTAGGDFYYTGDLSAVRVIQTTAGSIVNVSYYR